MAGGRRYPNDLLPTWILSHVKTFQSIAALLCICAASGYLNQKTFRCPPVLAMTITSIAVAVSLVILGRFGVIPLHDVETFIRSFEFADLVLHGLLGLLLFAGALFVDVEHLRRWAKPVAALATVGVFLSALVVGLLLWSIAGLFGYHLSFWWCLLFGSIIAATDPIAALAIVKKAGAPKEMETKLVGESLLNDGTSVMLFLIVLGIIQTGEVTAQTLVHEMFVAPIGAAALGWGLGKVTTHAISKVDDHPTEILMTLALATGVYSLAGAIHVSAPIAVVAAGLVIGHEARHKAMSEKTREHLDAFWEGLDEVLNTVLFALIGLELIIIQGQPMLLLLGALAWVIVLVGRWVGVFGSLLPMHRRGGLGRGTTRVLVWGGLRGGISLALALSLPAGPEASVLVTLTFIVVAMSASIQGLTLAKVLPRQVAADKAEESEEADAEAARSEGTKPS